MSAREVYALRYATSSSPKAQKFHRYSDHGEPDGDDPYGMDFFFWLVRDAERTILVDCGFAADHDYPGYPQDTDPVELLARMDVTPDQVDHVVLTHLHFDHIGNVGLFPNATFSVARAEFEFWTGRYGRKPHVGIGGLPREIAAVEALRGQDRLWFLDGEDKLAPGVTLLPVRGHTPGQLITTVDTGAGQIVLASDAAHFYVEFERDRPFWLFVDLEGMFRTYEVLRELAERPDTVVVPGHDPAVATRYVEVAKNCFDLTVRNRR
jgi:glyoxylase-like metal-dependent hydrolase (beta-lactamase superfamily II)